jgi:hypothetical protein
MWSLSHLIIQGDAEHIPLENDSVDLSFFSPPYTDARTYGIGAQRNCVDWIDWMLRVIRESCRVSRGLVLVNCAGVTRDRNYQPGPEGLLYEAWKAGITCWRPCYWRRVGIPGSGGAEWFRADVEYILAFTTCETCPPPIRSVVHSAEVSTKHGPRLQHTLECGHRYKRKDLVQEIACGHCVRLLPFSDNTACGHPPKWGPGGEMSHRLSDGKRVNQWGPVGSSKGFGKRFKHGDELQEASTPRPSHVIDTRSERSKILVPYGGAVSNQTEDGAARNIRTGGAAAAFGKKQSPGSRRPDGELKTPYFNGNSFRVNERRADGSRMRVTAGYGPTGEQLPNRETAFPVLANPGNLLDIIVGGGVMGSKLAHLNEAPFPIALPEFFIKSFVPVGGIVLDCFSGSGSTMDAARRCGRRAIGMDLRFNQCELGRRRMLEPVKEKKVKSKRARRAPKLASLFD